MRLTRIFYNFIDKFFAEEENGSTFRGILIIIGETPRKEVEQLRPLTVGRILVLLFFFYSRTHLKISLARMKRFLSERLFFFTFPFFPGCCCSISGLKRENARKINE